MNLDRVGSGRDLPNDFNVIIEIPMNADPIKYEVDKETGYLRVDRPQRTNALPPALYGFVPRTWCGPRVGALAPGATFGDRDPLDICVFSERPILRSEVVLTVRVLGVLRMVDKGEADDKIVAVLANDPYWAEAFLAACSSRSSRSGTVSASVSSASMRFGSSLRSLNPAPRVRSDSPRASWQAASRRSIIRV
jgi:inorganic pyrophosphatase